MFSDVREETDCLMSSPQYPSLISSSDLHLGPAHLGANGCFVQQNLLRTQNAKEAFINLDKVTKFVI